MQELLTGREVDRLLRYPRGRSARLARRGDIPHVELPDGEIRFDPSVLRDWLNTRGGTQAREVVPCQ